MNREVESRARARSGSMNAATKLIEKLQITSIKNDEQIDLNALATNHRLPKNFVDYKDAKFNQKESQKEQVLQRIIEIGFIPEELINIEVEYFYNYLGISDTYFMNESIETVADHILGLYAAKVSAFSRGKREDSQIKLDREDEDHAVYILIQMKPKKANNQDIDSKLDSLYLNRNSTELPFRVEAFQSQNSQISHQLQSSFVTRCKFNCEYPYLGGCSDIRTISDQSFLEKASQNTIYIYDNVLKAVCERFGPVIEAYDMEGSKEKRLIIGYMSNSSSMLYSAMSSLLDYYGLIVLKKYVEQFANGATIMSFYLAPTFMNATNKEFPPIESSIHQVMKDASLLYCIPRGQFLDLFARDSLALQEAVYAHCVCHFIGHFMNRLGHEYITLSQVLDLRDSVQADVLSKLKRRLRQETFTEGFIKQIIHEYPDLVHCFYINFAAVHYIFAPRNSLASLGPSLSYQYIVNEPILTDEQLEKLVASRTSNDTHYSIMMAFLKFNNHVLKTNFFQPTKVAISFRLDPSFLSSFEYLKPLYGMFFILGNEFRGFHLRFQNVSRGGIRIVRSRNSDSYIENARTLFDENYNLANTQQRKNKDIPEGGAKGVILLNHDKQDKAELAFQKYIDALLDLLLEGSSPGIKEKIVDLLGKEEIIFCGPDEGTAGMVDWATIHARERGARWWHSFFTGKSPHLGGIPHDFYGMTSLSVRRYIVGIYNELGIDEKQMTKVQTGGPDGDLGSNEIKLSHEKYLTIIDGSGVLHDPIGINREELLRLANERKMISNFNRKLLSKDGYVVLVDDKNIQLPNGETVFSGITFRNTAHLRYQANVFVPCGGRPEAIDIGNVDNIIQNGKPYYDFIVEGANLFLTQDAKIKLESLGCVIYKDASANKGGVTSSSLEVLASLVFDDEQFSVNMCVKKDGLVPEFYKNYVKEVQAIIQQNADYEFKAISEEHKKSGTPRSIISDQLSTAIVDLREELQQSRLFENTALREVVLLAAIPKTILAETTLDEVQKKVPESYLRAYFSSYLASRFIYEYGIQTGKFAFFDYMEIWNAKVVKNACN